MQSAEYGADLSGQRLESPQRALRLGQHVQAMVGGGPAASSTAATGLHPELSLAASAQRSGTSADKGFELMGIP